MAYVPDPHAQERFSFWVVLLLLSLTFTVAIVGIVVAGIKEQRQWEKFKAEHECKVVAHVAAGYKTSPKEGWLCNDGITYFR
jgi:flagellar basal body-associated protein FliL